MPDQEAKITPQTEAFDIICQLDRAIYSTTRHCREICEAPCHINIIGLITAAKVASGITEISQWDVAGDGHPSIEYLGAIRQRIYKAFGAPGSWGYGTPIGTALSKLYEIKLS